MSTAHIAASPTRVSIEGGDRKERDARRSRRLCQDRGLRHDATALSRLTSARGHPGTTPTRAYVPRPSWGNKQWAPLYGRPLAQRSCKRMLGMYTPQGCQGGPGKEERGCNSSCRMKSSEQPPRRIAQHPPSPAWMVLARSSGHIASSYHPLEYARRIVPQLTPHRAADKSSSQLRHDGSILDAPCHSHQKG